MNLFNGIVTVVNKPEMRYTSNNQTPIASFRLTIKEYGEGTVTIDAKAWGKLAEEAVKWDAGTTLIVSGALNMLRVEKGEFKETIASLNLSTAQILSCEAVAFNSIVIAGNVGQDVDARHFDSGTNNAKTSLAVKRTKDETDWFSLEAWGKTAETMERYVTKGSKVGAIGSLKIETWTDKNTGIERSKPVIKVDRIEFLGSKKDAETQATSGYADDF